MKMTIKINLDNDSFMLNGSSFIEEAEIVWSIRNALGGKDIYLGQVESVFDVNGNTIGTVKVTK